MNKIAVLLTVLLLIFGTSVISEESVGNNKIAKKLEEMREASLKEMKLSNYPPESIKGFNKKESHTPADHTLDVWEAEAGWLTFWEASNSGYEVNYHDLMVDVYKFSTEEKARRAIINEMETVSGEISFASLHGLPYMVVTWWHEGTKSVDVFIGYHQEKMIILIQVSKDVMDDKVPPDQLLQEAKRAFRAIVAKGRQ